LCTKRRQSDEDSPGTARRVRFPSDTCAPGLAGDLEPVDLTEVLLQAAIYAGVPAANTGFQIAAEELERHSKPE
jgi:hypothetical protein